MAKFKCKNCGFEEESRCKPNACPECDEFGTFEKKEESKNKK
jgi:predicted Zn-ribbon and HTH transcriptional regulator